MKRDILNYLGDKIGELELPEGTSEEVWDKKLAVYSAPPVVEEIPNVNPRQIRSALLLNNITEEQIIEAFGTLEEPNKSLAVIGWKYSLNFVRSEPIVSYLGVRFELSSEWIDNLWVLAATL